MLSPENKMTMQMPTPWIHTNTEGRNMVKVVEYSDKMMFGAEYLELRWH